MCSLLETVCAALCGGYLARSCNVNEPQSARLYCTFLRGLWSCSAALLIPNTPTLMYLQSHSKHDRFCGQQNARQRWLARQRAMCTTRWGQAPNVGHILVHRLLLSRSPNDVGFSKQLELAPEFRQVARHDQLGRHHLGNRNTSTRFVYTTTKHGIKHTRSQVVGLHAQCAMQQVQEQSKRQANLRYFYIQGLCRRRQEPRAPTACAQVPLLCG